MRARPTSAAARRWCRRTAAPAARWRRRRSRPLTTRSDSTLTCATDVVACSARSPAPCADVDQRGEVLAEHGDRQGRPRPRSVEISRGAVRAARRCARAPRRRRGCHPVAAPTAARRRARSPLRRSPYAWTMATTAPRTATPATMPSADGDPPHGATGQPAAARQAGGHDDGGDQPRHEGRQAEPPRRLPAQQGVDRQPGRQRPPGRAGSGAARRSPRR